MLKKLLSAAIILAMIFAVAAPVLAQPSGTVGKFTPTIDGEKDEAYEQSFSFNIFDQDSTTRGEGWWSTHGNQSTDMDANIWFLWDDEFLYAYVEVIMDEVINIGDDHILNHDNPWEANSVELWLLWDDLYNSGDRLKTSVEPLHNRTWGDGPFFEDLEPDTQKVAKLTPNGYSAEFAIPIPSNFLTEGGTVKLTLQVNVFDGEGSIPVGLQVGTDNLDFISVLTLGAPIATTEPEAEDEPEVAAVEAVETEIQAVPISEPAPQTNDGIVLILLVGFAAICGMAAIYKKIKA